MKNVDSRDVPAVSGGVKPGDIGDNGDCLPDINLPSYPQFPKVPVDPEYIDPINQ